MNKNNFVETSYNKPFIKQRADPYIYKHIDGSYYFTASVPEYDRIVLRHSDTMIGLKDAEEVSIWRKHESGIMIYGLRNFIIWIINGLFIMQQGTLMIYGL